MLNGIEISVSSSDFYAEGIRCNQTPTVQILDNLIDETREVLFRNFVEKMWNVSLPVPEPCYPGQFREYFPELISPFKERQYDEALEVLSDSHAYPELGSLGDYLDAMRKC